MLSFSIVRPCLAALCCLVLLSCNPSTHRSNQDIPPADTAAVTVFLSRLSALDTIADPAVKSQQLVALYNGTKPAVRAHGMGKTIAVLRMLLHYGGAPDSALMALIHGIFTDPAIAERHKARVALNMASHYALIRSSPDSAIRYLDLLDQHKGGINDTLRSIRYNILAEIRLLQGRQNEAIDARYQSIAIKEKLHDSLGLMSTYINLANTYRNMSNPRKAADLMGKAISYTGKHTENEDWVVIYTGLGDDLCALGKTDSALHYLAAAEALFDQGTQNPPIQFTTYVLIAQNYLDAGNHRRAIDYFEKARALLPVFQDAEMDQSWTLSAMPAYAHARDVRPEMDTARTWLAQYFQAGDLLKAQNAAQSLYGTALVLRDFETALKFSNLRDSIGGVITAKDNRDYLAEMETKYETGKKALQIQLQQKEIRRRSQLNIILTLSLVAAALLAVGIITRMKLTRTRREAGMQAQFTQRLLLQTEEERSRIAAELHDSISHELLTLKNGLHQPGTEPSSRIDGIINDIRRISRNLHPVMLDKIGLEASIHHLCGQLTEGGDIFVTAEVDCPRRLSPDLELQLFRIVQESLSNAAKYSGAHAAKVNLAAHNGTVNLTVLDNGKGFNVGEKLAARDSFGLHTLVERGKAIGGKTTITSATQGTAIHLQAPSSYAKQVHHGA